MKKILATVLTAAVAVSALAACSGGNTGNSSTTATATTAAATTAAVSFDTGKEISVISREEGSGTRGAFIELFGIEEKNSNGEKVDHTTLDALITNNTSVMLTTVSGDKYAIGYVSMGSLNDTVKAVKINDAEATVANIKSGTYKIARPFNIATKGTVSAAAQDFINFIISKDGQAVIENNGYISVSDAAAFTSTKPTGKVVVAGSSSVTPVMEKLKEAYLAINSNAQIEIQQSDSTTGMTSTIDGICDIGMASRALKDSEVEKGLKSTVIAMDGIAVIINKDNPVKNLTSEQVKTIFKGEAKLWKDVIKG